jgi:hypothetical protein
MEPLITPVALRHWPQLAEPTDKPEEKTNRDFFERSLPIGDRVLVFDTETTTDERQALRFGFYRLYERGRMQEEGLFVAETLQETEADAEALCRIYADTSGIRYLSRRDFAELLMREGYGLGTLIVGFNLPFDLTRIAVYASVGKGANREAFFVRLSGLPSRPDLRIQAIAERGAFIQWLKPKCNGNRRGTRRHFRGRFLDLATLTQALSGKPHSLRSAGEAFKASALKSEGEESHGGTLTNEYLNYARQDVTATYALYVRLNEIYSGFPFADKMKGTGKGNGGTAITELYSAASIAKATLKHIGINVEHAIRSVPPEFCGFAMAAYYGGRSEVHVRRTEVPAAVVDFTSQYPAVFTLLHLWRFVSAKSLTVRTLSNADVERLLQEIADRPERLYNRELWPKLASFVQIVPNGEMLPVRIPKTVQTDTDAPDERTVLTPAEARDEALADTTVTLAPLSADVPMWYALPDLVASVLLTGKVPRIEQAFTVEVEGERKLSMFRMGDVVIRPGLDFFAEVIANRKRLEREENAQALGLKMLANSGAYGIFAEFNPVLLEQQRHEQRLNLHSEITLERALSGKWEKPGNFACPFVGSLVTAGGRLLLALLQREIEDRNGAFCWLAVDAMAVVLEPGASGVPGIDRADLDRIRDRFQRLSPYNADAVPEFLRVEAEGTAYAISANRYCLRTADGTFQKATSSGMGGLIPPNGERLSEFSKVVWQAILSGNIPAEWERAPLRRKFPIRKPATFQTASSATAQSRTRYADDTRQAAEYSAGVKPFNFLQVVSLASGGGNYFGPYRRDAQAMLKTKFWNKTGASVKVGICPYVGAEPTKGMIYCQTIADFVRSYREHTDSKMLTMDGKPLRSYTAGRLQPRPIKRCGSYLIGKEIDRVAVSEDASAAYVESEPVPIIRMAERRRVRRLATKPEPLLARAVAALNEHPPKLIAEHLGISVRQWYRIIRGEDTPKEAVQKRILSRYHSGFSLWL